MLTETGTQQSMEFKRSRKISTELEMAPLIDVVFLLLIFFMLTSSFSDPEQIELKLPEAESSAQSTEDEVLNVALDAEGTVYLNQSQLSLEELEDQLRPRFASKPDQPVLLKSDAGAQVEQMISVLDKIRLSGGTNVNIATQAKP